MIRTSQCDSYNWNTGKTLSTSWSFFLVTFVQNAFFTKCCYMIPSKKSGNQQSECLKLNSGKIAQLAKLNNSTFKSPLFRQTSFITHFRKLSEKVLTQYQGKLHFLNFCDFFSDPVMFISSLILLLNCVQFFLNLTAACVIFF